MPDNTLHATTVAGQQGMLSIRYADDPNIFVGMHLQLEATEGQRRDVVVPDVLVVFGVPDKDRDSYKVSEEGRVPDFALEVASKGTYENDAESKKDMYERMGVREYCVFDPKGGMHWPRLQLFRLDGGVYKDVNWRGDPDGPLRVTSETLALELRFEDGRMRLWDPATREYLLEHQDEHDGRMRERAGRMRERAGRLEELDKRLEERAGRLEERDKRIAAEQRARDLETRLADLGERLRRKP